MEAINVFIGKLVVESVSNPWVISFLGKRGQFLKNILQLLCVWG